MTATALPPPAPSADAAPEAPRPAEGLRERKKRETRGRLHRTALELALARGLDSVTVEQIATQAQVSARTFFNYFPTKESAVVGMSTDFVDRFVGELVARPADEGVLTSLQRVVEARSATLAAEPELRRQRIEAFRRWPGLLATAAGSTGPLERALAAHLAERLGVDPTRDIRPGLYVGCATAVLRAAMSVSQEELSVAIAAGFDALRAGLADLPPAPTPPAADPVA